MHWCLLCTCIEILALPLIDICNKNRYSAGILKIWMLHLVDLYGENKCETDLSTKAEKENPYVDL